MLATAAGPIVVAASPTSVFARTVVAASAVSAETPIPRAISLEVGVHLLGRVVPVGGILREGSQDDVVEVARDLGPVGGRRTGACERCFIAISTGVSPVNGTEPVSSS